jgi:uncharacterized membrane protein
MYLIPHTWSHWHMLMSVFPPFGLLFTLGFYVAGLRTHNDVIKRTCLVVLVGLALLSVPIYLSGQGAASPASPRIAKEMLGAHTSVGIAALIALLATGLAALVELVRSRRSAVDPRHVVLALAVIALGVMAVASELGFETSHRELQSTVVIPDVTTSPIWPHVHVILNHFPTTGFAFAIFFYLAALLTNNAGMKRGSLILFIITAIVGVPTYVTGTASMWALTQPPIPEISKAVINAHRDMALWTVVGLAFTGGAAWIELWRYRHVGRFSGLSLALVLLLALATLGIMTETGHRGGLITHPEIRTALDTVPVDPNVGVSMALEQDMKSINWFLPWQIVHFFGYSLIFASVLAVSLRVLGFWKSLSYAAAHRLLVLGFLGVLMNVLSGMLMMLADSYRYVVSDVLFGPKVALIPLAVMVGLYFSVSERLWQLKPGEAAPAGAKWVAVGSLLAWAGVIACGRLLPYL